MTLRAAERRHSYHRDMHEVVERPGPVMQRLECRRAGSADGSTAGPSGA